LYVEKPEGQEDGGDKKLLFSIVSKTFTSIIFKIVDIGTDLGTQKISITNITGFG
jgi:hypothetical protein